MTNIWWDMPESVKKRSLRKANKASVAARAKVTPADCKKLSVTLSPWILECISYVRAEEQLRTGKAPNVSRVLRGLMAYGMIRFKELKRLPEVDR